MSAQLRSYCCLSFPGLPEDRSGIKFYKFFQADTQEEFDDFYNNIKQLSQYDTGVTAQFGDHFLTLSTCVYHVEQGRFVVVAKETDPGDHYLPIQE